MDRNSIIGFGLIGVVLVAYMIYSSVTTRPMHNTATKKVETVIKQADTPSPKSDRDEFVNVGKNKVGKLFEENAIGTEKLITIETGLYKAVISNKGPAIKKWYLKDFKKWDGVQTQLVKDSLGDFYNVIYSAEGKKVDTRYLFFTFDTQNTNVKLSGKESYTLTAKLNNGNGSITKTFTFYGDKYIFDTDLKIENLEDKINPRGLDLVWGKGLTNQEKNSVDEASESKVMAVMNGEPSEIHADEETAEKTSETGVVDYTAVKSKYFTVAVIPSKFDGTVDLSGNKINYPETKGVVKQFEMSYRLPYKGGDSYSKYSVYFGPIKYSILKDYGLERVVNFGWWIIRYIGQYFMMPLFNFLHTFLPSYGITLIIFSILIKLMLYPLSITQMQSAHKMKLLAPEMQKIKDKFPDDLTKQQQATMSLYSEYGVNPASGCLPMLLQMPILYSLWVVLRSNIDLRQSGFILWINDLSIPDTILHWDYSIMGISSISGLSLAMGITMFVQQKMTISDPRQKSMIYVMPVMFIFMFSSFPAGLNLYYFMFNLLGIIQQFWINNFSSDKLTLEEMRKSPKKESWLAKKMKEAQALTEAQNGDNIQKNNDYYNKVQKNKKKNK